MIFFFPIQVIEATVGWVGWVVTGIVGGAGSIFSGIKNLVSAKKDIPNPPELKDAETQVDSETEILTEIALKFPNENV